MAKQLKYKYKTMAKFKKIFFLIIILIFVFHKKLITIYYVNKFSNWVEKEIVYDKIYINYKFIILNGSGKWDRTTDLRLMSPAL